MDDIFKYLELDTDLQHYIRDLDAVENGGYHFYDYALPRNFFTDDTEDELVLYFFKTLDE